MDFHTDGPDPQSHVYYTCELITETEATQEAVWLHGDLEVLI